MEYLRPLLVVSHIIVAAAWFGLGLRLSGQARSVLRAERAVATALVAEGIGTVRLMNVFAALTLLLGLGALFAGGGFGAYGPAYHTSLMLMVALLVVQRFVVTPGWAALESGVSAQATGNLLESARKRVAMGTGINHLLWLVTLVLMLWNQYFAPVAR